MRSNDGARKSALLGCAYVNGSRWSAEGVDGSDVAVLRTTFTDGGVSFGEADSFGFEPKSASVAWGEGHCDLVEFMLVENRPWWRWGGGGAGRAPSCSRQVSVWPPPCGQPRLAYRYSVSCSQGLRRVVSPPLSAQRLTCSRTRITHRQSTPSSML